VVSGSKQSAATSRLWPEPGVDDRQLPGRPLRTASFRWDDRAGRASKRPTGTFLPGVALPESRPPRMAVRDVSGRAREFITE